MDVLYLMCCLTVDELPKWDFSPMTCGDLRRSWFQNGIEEEIVRHVL